MVAAAWSLAEQQQVIGRRLGTCGFKPEKQRGFFLFFSFFNFFFTFLNNFCCFFGLVCF